MFRFLSLLPCRHCVLDLRLMCRCTSLTPTPHKCHHGFWRLRKLWSTCYVGPRIAVYLSVAVCFYFLGSPRGWLADGPNLNQMPMKFHSRQLINLIFNVGPNSPWSVLSFPSNNVCVCVWSFFFGHKLRGVNHMWKHSPFGILADHSW